MEILAVSYVKYGYQFTQVRREGLAAIYEQRDVENDNKLIAYEVFEIQQLPDQLVGPNKYPKPARETPPGSESWGRLGYTAHSIERANELFSIVLSKLTMRVENKKKKK